MSHLPSRLEKTRDSRATRHFGRRHILGSLIIIVAFVSSLSAGLILPVRATPPTGTTFDHVVIIVMENEGIANTCGSKPPPCNAVNTPYLSSLANNFALGVQYTSISCGGCPTSQPNYVALLSGSNQGCSSGGCPTVTSQNLVDSLETAGLTWKGYFENQILNGQPYQGCDNNSNSQPYDNTHNPFIAFQDIKSNAARCNLLVDANPSSCTITDCALINDLKSASNAPNFMWLTPNNCDNMHAWSGCTNGCTSNNGQSATCIQDGDTYLKNLVPNILNSQTFTSTRSALFITFDEGLDWCPQTGSSSEDCIYALWAGPAAQNNFSSTALYNHYSFLKTIEANWNLPSLATNDANAQAMTEFFKPAAPDFTITSTPPSVTFNAGTTGSFTTTVTAQNGFTGTVNLFTSTSPTSGLSVTCNPTSISNGSGSSTCTLNSSTAGTYTTTVKGTNGTLSHTTRVTVTVAQSPAPDFALSANPSSLSEVQGSSGTSTITINSLDGFSGTVSLSQTTTASSLSASLNPTAVTLSSNGVQSSTLNVSTGNTPAGSYSINVTGTSGSISHSTTVTVSVTLPPDFSISATPTSLTLGQSFSSSLNSVPVTTSSDPTWFESSYLASSFYAQGRIWLFYEDSSVNCEGFAGCLFYTSSSNGSSWASPTNLNVHVTDSDFSVYTDASNVYYARYDEDTFESTCGMNLYFRTGILQGSTGTVAWQKEQTALKGLSTNVYPNEEIVVDSTGQAWIAFLSDSHSACGGNGTDLPQIVHSAGTNYASWTTPFTLSTAHSNNWHIALVSLGAGQIYASYWLANADLHGKLYNGSTWGLDEQISATTTHNDVNAWLFNSGTNAYAIYFDNGPETFNFASRSSSGTWTTSVIGAGESRTGTKFSSSYYSFPDAASFDPTHNQFYLFWMNATLQRIDEWKGIGNTWTKTTKIIGTTAAPYPDSITSFITASPTNSFPTTGGIFYITGSGAPFTYNFVALPLSSSSTGTFTVTITGQNGFTGTVILSTSIVPSTGLTVTCSPTSITGGSGQSTCTATGSTAGSYNVTVTGTSGSLSHSTSVSVIVQSSNPDFAISANPTSLTVNSSVVASSTIRITPLGGFSGTVNLAVSTNSTGLNCTLSSSSITSGSGTSTLSCNASQAANYLATVTGTSGSISHSATVTFHVQDFILAGNPTTVSTVVGASGTSLITVSQLNGFSQTVNLAVATNSTNLACTLSATSVNGSGSSTLSCKGASTGNFLATVAGTSGTLSHSVTVAYHVAAAPDFKVSANPTSVTTTTGTPAGSTITVTSLNGFTGTVTLAVASNSTSMSCALTSSTIHVGSGTSTLTCTGSAPGNFLANVTGTSGSLSHSVPVIYMVTLPSDFVISANPTIVSVPTGVPGTSNVTISPRNGFTGTVILSAVTNSTNLSCSLTPASVPGGSGTSSLSCTGNAAGNYLVTVTGSNNTLSHSATITYHVKTTSDYNLTTSPTSVALNAGIAGNSTVTITPLNGFNGTVTLTVVTNSTALQCALNPTSVSGGSGTSTLSCTGEAAGNYLASVTGTSSALSHSASVSYNVHDFALTANPANESVGVGVPGNSTVTITSVNGFSGTVSLSVTTNSTTLVCSLSASSVAGGSGSSDLSCTGTLPGNYLATVSGISGNLLHQASVTYHVTVILAKDFTVSTNPTIVAVDAGALGNSTVTVTPVNGFTGTVNLSVTTNSTSLSCTLTPAAITGGSGKSILSCSGSPFGSYLANVTGASGSLSHSATVQFNTQDYTILSNPSSLAIQTHPSDGNSTITVSSQNGFTNNIVLNLTTNSANINCTLSQTSFAGGSGSAILSCSSGVAGNYLATILASDGKLSHSATVTYQVQDFTVNASPTSVGVNTGSLGNSTITVASLNGFSGAVTLAVTTSSTNLSCNLAPASIPGGSGVSTLSCTASVQGKYNATVIGTSGSVSHTSFVMFSVTAPDFKLSANPVSISIVQGSLGSSNVTLTSLNGFSGSISLTAVTQTGLVVGLNPSVDALVANGVVSSMLSINSTSATPASYSINITATGGSFSHSLIITVTIINPVKPSPYALIVTYEGFVYKLYPNNTLVQTAHPVTTSLNVVSWRPDGSCAIIAGNAAVLIKYDGTTLTTVPTGIATSVNFLSTAWRPDGSYALIGGSGGVLLKYDCNTVSQVSNSFAVSFRAISWRPDGSQALLVTYFGKIYQYSSATGTIVQLTSPTTQSLDAVAWNPNGSYALIAGSGGAILRYDGSTLTVLNTATVYTSTLTVRYISFNPAGNLALLVGDSGLVLTYDGTTLAALPAVTSSTLYSVSWSNGTAYIAGGVGALITYSGGVETSIPNNTYSGFRSVAWKP